ncbi:MAG: hypothetical protein ABIN95_11440, partial [Mucilaginibacter sp.]
YQQRINALGNFTSGTYIGPYTYFMGLPGDAQGNRYDITIADNPNPPQPANAEARIVLSKYNSSGTLLWQVNAGNINKLARTSYPKINSQGQVIIANPMGTLYRYSASGQLIGASAYGDYDAGIELDKNDNIYLFSYTTGKLQKFSSTGSRIWAIRNEPSTNTAPKIASITVDNSGNVYAAGNFYETSDLDPGTGVYKVFKTKGSSEDIFVQKLNSDGQFVWAMYTNYYGGSVGISPSAIKVDPSGEYIVVAGSMSGLINFNPTGTLLLANTTLYDSYSFIWGIRQCK